MTATWNSWTQSIYGFYTLLLLNKYFSLVVGFIVNNLPSVLSISKEVTEADKATTEDLKAELEDAKRNEEGEKTEGKESSSWYSGFYNWYDYVGTNVSQLSKLKTVASISSGLLFSYMTGSHAYVLSLINLVFIIIANLPTFCCVGAPFIAIMLKILKFSKFNLHFLRGWYVLTLLIVIARPVYLLLVSLLVKFVTESAQTLHRPQRIVIYQIELVVSGMEIIEILLEMSLAFGVYIFYQIEAKHRKRYIKKVFDSFSIENAQRMLADFTEEVMSYG